MKNQFLESVLKIIQKDEIKKEIIKICKPVLLVILNEIYPGEFKSVPDPYYGGEQGFKNIYDMLEKACERIISKYESR